MNSTKPSPEAGIKIPLNLLKAVSDRSSSAGRGSFLQQKKTAFYSSLFYLHEQSISRVLFHNVVMIIYLDRKLLSCSSGNNPEGQRATSSLPYSALLQMGFTKPASYLTAGALLPHLSTLTANAAVSFSMALSLGSPPPDVIRHPALRSSDFPQTSKGPQSSFVLTADSISQAPLKFK